MSVQFSKREVDVGDKVTKGPLRRGSLQVGDARPLTLMTDQNPRENISLPRAPSGAFQSIRALQR